MTDEKTKLGSPACHGCGKNTLEWFEDNSCACTECAMCFILGNGYYGRDNVPVVNKDHSAVKATAGD